MQCAYECYTANTLEGILIVTRLTGCCDESLFKTAPPRLWQMNRVGTYLSNGDFLSNCNLDRSSAKSGNTRFKPTEMPRRIVVICRDPTFGNVIWERVAKPKAVSPCAESMPGGPLQDYS
jgi:hypothetical protein